MFNIGGGEFLIILLVALIVLGPNKLPDAARTVGKVIGEFRRLSAGFQAELKEAMDDPVGKVVNVKDAEKAVAAEKAADAEHKSTDGDAQADTDNDAQADTDNDTDSETKADTSSQESLADGVEEGDSDSAGVPDAETANSDSQDRPKRRDVTHVAVPPIAPFASSDQFTSWEPMDEVSEVAESSTDPDPTGVLVKDEDETPAKVPDPPMFGDR